MNHEIMRRCLIAVLTLGFAFALPAQQQRGNVEVVVRNQQGDSLPFARVRVTGNDNDIATRANARGRVTIVLNYGIAHIAVSTLGYQSNERNVTVNAASASVPFMLQVLPRQLSEVEVREPWVGIRGGIADAETRRGLEGVTVSSRLGNVKVVTDKDGRFEIPMYEAEPMVLQLSATGYQVRPAHVDVLKDGPTDVVFFMTMGKNIKGEVTRLTELDRRIKVNKIYAFTMSGADLRATKKKTLYDALESSGFLLRNHMQMGTVICLFVDGIAWPNLPVNSALVDDIDFIEVIGQKSEATMTLMSEWPKYTPCFSHEFINPIVGTGLGKRYVGIISVWTVR